MPEIQSANKLNTIEKGSPKYSSTLDMERRKYFTPVFGKYVPFEAFECVPDDGPVSFRNESEQRSLSLSSPLMNKISISKDWFDVPFEAILPFNWDKIYKNPKLGSDIDASLANTVIPNFHYIVAGLISNEFSSIRNSETIDYSTVSRFIRWLLTSELFISDGSLLAHLGCHFSPIVSFSYSGSSDYKNFDFVVDYLCEALIDPTDYLTASFNQGYNIRLNSAANFRKFLDSLRAGDTYEFIGGLDLSEFTARLRSLSASRGVGVVNSAESVLNYSRCCAYQIVCAHFYTNDDVDYVYSAELYREYVHSLFLNLVSSSIENARSFSYNGLNCRYDWLSGTYFRNLLSSSANFFGSYYPIFNAVFGFNNSLRFADYFVGAKVRPIAIGDTNVSINADNTVSVVNITKNIQAQRFLNTVNRLKSGMDDYIKGVFGVEKISRDWHNPGWLAHTSDDVFANEVENTGEAQLTQANSITSNLRGSGRFEFTYYCERPCIVIGIEYFDIRRAYYTTQDKHTMKVDRFDGFIPEMQFIGDQPITRQELISSESLDAFGYTTRNMEYKQLYDEAFGGFVNNLPGWLFKYLPFDYLDEGSSTSRVQLVQKPSFIRSRSSELDSYFVSLTGFSLMSGYYHFIEKSTTYISARRPMVKSPSIL